MAEKINVARSQLSKFIPDHDTMVQFETLITLVNSLEIDGTETLEEIILRVHEANP